MTEQILEPELPIVDPHHHLWDRPRGILRNLPPSDHGFMDIINQIPRYLLDELLADLNIGHNIRATVYMECGAMYRADGPEALRCVGETEFVNGVAAMTASGLYGDVRACAAIVGHADLRLGAAVEEGLRAHLAAAGGRFRGVRQSASWDEDPKVLGPLAGRVPAGLYRDATFRDGFALLQRLGLSFDAWLLEPQLPDLIDLARAFPETTIVLDHVGTPLGIAAYAGKREARFGPWRESLRTPATCPDVGVKAAGWVGDAVCGLRLIQRVAPSVLRGSGAGVEALRRCLHRSLRAGALHVRKQLPGGQLDVQLRDALERFQTAGGEPFARREDRALQRHGGAGLSVERRVSGGIASAAAVVSKDGERSQ